MNELRETLIEVGAQTLCRTRSEDEAEVNWKTLAPHYREQASEVLDAILDGLEAQASDWAQTAWTLNGRENVLDLITVLRSK